MESAVGYILFSVIMLIGVMLPSVTEQNGGSSPNSSPTGIRGFGANKAVQNNFQTKKSAIKSSFLQGFETTLHPVEVGEIDEEDHASDFRTELTGKEKVLPPSKMVFFPPVREVRVISKFGNRVHPISKKVKFHSGVDFDGERGDAILSVADGIVSFVGRKNGYGKAIEITHSDRWKSFYAHLDKTRVKVGQKVKAGVLIAEMGNSGQSTGVHLHLELHDQDRAVNPQKKISFN